MPFFWFGVSAACGMARTPNAKPPLQNAHLASTLGILVLALLHVWRKLLAYWHSRRPLSGSLKLCIL